MEGSTRDAVKKAVKDHPEWTQADIARAVDVSRERVRQILATEGLTVPSYAGVGQRLKAGQRTAKPRVITGGVPVAVSNTVAGTIGELLAGADLMARGLKVFFPLTRTGHCDLITLDERTGRTERIEVRCGKRRDGRITWQTPDKSRSDRRAVVLTGEPVFYEPPFPG